MRLCLIRHGETAWNKSLRLQGREDIPLNETGIKQAKDCASALVGQVVDVVVSSPLSRARDTARMIADAVGLKGIQEDVNVIERDFGEASGLTYDQLKEKRKQGRIHGIESIEELRLRMFHVLNSYEKKYPNGTVFIVTHGASIKAIVGAIDPDAFTGDAVQLKNTGITVIDCNQGRYQINDFNLEPQQYRERYS